MIMWDYENIKAFLKKGYTPNWSEEVLGIENLELLYHGHMY